MKNLLRLISIFLLSIFLVLSLFPIQVSSTAMNSAQLIEYINSYRSINGLSPLVSNSSLTSAAYIRAQELSLSFSHTRPDGSQWYTAGDKLYAENLARAWNEEQSKPLNVAYAWYMSPSHKAVLLHKSLTNIGVSYYEKDGITYIVAEFNY